MWLMDAGIWHCGVRAACVDVWVAVAVDEGVEEGIHCTVVASLVATLGWVYRGRYFSVLKRVRWSRASSLSLLVFDGEFCLVFREDFLTDAAIYIY